MDNQQLETVKSEYRQLSDVEHVLLRSEIYSGSRQMTKGVKYLLHNDGKIYLDEIEYVPAVNTFANELLCNSFDEAVRTNAANSDRPWKLDVIDVVIDLKMHSLTVRDNGGILVAIDGETRMPIPTMIFGHLRTGSNYDSHDDRGGQNGLGVKIVNIFSKNFHLFTADGRKSFQQSWHDNMSIADDPVIKDRNDHFTEVIAEFDLDSNRTKIDPAAYGLTFARCIEMRCAEIAAMACDWQKPLTVLFKCINEDGSEWTNKFCFRSFNDYLALWPNNENFIVDKQYRFNIAFGLSIGSTESSAIVNALQCPWGTMIDTYMDACVWHIRNYINNKFKIDVKPAKIKSYIKAISTWQINNATFSGQTKEVLISAPSDFGMPVIPSEQFIKKLLRSEIVNVIIEEMHNRIAAQRRSELAQQQKEIDKRTKRNILPQKLTDAANAGRNKYAELYVVEGDSAATGLKRFRNAETQGVFALFGKSISNLLYADEFRILSNKATSALCQGLGFSFITTSNLRYQKIIIATDADYDGYAIAGLLLIFFNKFMPEVIERGQLYRLVTPIVTVTNSKTNVRRQFYNLQDFEQAKGEFKGKDWRVQYNKGLASLDDETYDELMRQPKLQQIVKDDFADDSLTVWFGRDPQKRKEAMAMAELVDDIFNDLFTEVQEQETEQSVEEDD